MKVIGLTGGTGSGKSVVSLWLKQHGAAIIDADEIAHQIIEKGKPAYQELIAHFGGEILDENKNIIRKKLGSIVFSDEKELLFLNHCTHKYISEEIHNKITAYTAQKTYSLIIIDAPLLLEVGLQNDCDEVWVVFAQEEVRLQRIMDRDHLSEKQARNRMESQQSWDIYEKAAQIVIDNSRDLKFLEQQLFQLLLPSF